MFLFDEPCDKFMVHYNMLKCWCCPRGFQKHMHSTSRTLPHHAHYSLYVVPGSFNTLGSTSFCISLKGRRRGSHNKPARPARVGRPGRKVEKIGFVPAAGLPAAAWTARCACLVALCWRVASYPLRFLSATKEKKREMKGSFSFFLHYYFPNGALLGLGHSTRRGRGLQKVRCFCRDGRLTCSVCAWRRGPATRKQEYAVPGRLSTRFCASGVTLHLADAASTARGRSGQMPRR